MSSRGHDLDLPQVHEENICLPLSVNAVCKYWGVDISIDEARKIATKYAGIRGSILIEGIELAELQGLWCAIHHSSLDTLKHSIDAGVPPIVILPGVQDTVQHASVISGYDDKEGAIFHYIPEASREGEFQMGAIPQSRFTDIWSEDGMILIAIATTDIGPSLKLGDELQARSNRMCFEAERLSIQNKVNEATQMLRDAIKLDFTNSTAHSLLAGMLNSMASEECITHYNNAIKINPRCYLAYRGLGNYYLKVQDYALAEHSYTSAIKINATRFGPIYKNRGIVRLEQGNKDGARQDLEEYIRIMPSASDRKSIRKAISEI